jgi:hypothetical protein
VAFAARQPQPQQPPWQQQMAGFAAVALSARGQVHRPAGNSGTINCDRMRMARVIANNLSSAWS